MTLRRGNARMRAAAKQPRAHVPWLALGFALVAVFVAVRIVAALLVLK
jgi:hypothetical protein